MKRILKFGIILIFLLIIVGCENKNEQHTHNYSINTIPATCTEKGSIEYKCPCGYFYIEEIELSDHVFSAWTIVEEAGINKEGKKQRICLQCKYVETDIIAAETHTHMYTGKVVHPTCTEKGYTEYECECGHKYQENEINPLGHAYTDWVIVKEATETENGFRQKKCIICGDVISETIIYSHIHTYQENIIEADCENYGYTEYKCECGYSYKDRYVNPLGHKYEEWKVVKEATETEEGLKEQECSRCKDKVTENIPVKEHVHNYISTIINPTCTSQGYTEYTCGCKNTYRDNYTDPTGHIEEKIEGIEPTYTETGLSEGVKCKVCNIIIVEQKTLPMLVDKTLSITWYDPKFDMIEEERTYDSSKGLNSKEFLVLEKEGYEFLGWSLKRVIESENDLVSIITKGHAQSITLYAQWKPIEYNIIYNGAFKNCHSNPTKYTIEDAFTLENAEWTGLKFVQWCDIEGKKIDYIELGTIGDITLEAQWASEENQVVQSKDLDYSIEYDEENQLYYFVFYVGTIENVVINELFSQYKHVGESLSYNKTNTVSIGSESATTVSNTISEYVSKTVNWEETIGEIKSKTEGNESGFKFGGSVSIVPGIGGYEAAVENKHIESKTNTDSKETTNGTSDTSGESYENTFSSTVAYNSTYSTSITASLNVSETSPQGTYRFVSVGKVYVFTVLTFNFSENKFYFDTYSVMDDKLVGMSLYTPDSDLNINVSYSKGFDYEIPNLNFVEEMKNAYKVRYNSNGGKGEMSQSVFFVDQDGKLQENKFSKDGYSFIGWSKTPEGPIEFNKEEIVNNIGSKDEEIDLYAQWVANSYEVTLNPNEGKLVNKQIKVTYDEEYGELPEPVRYGYEFLGWYYENTKIDNRSIVKLNKDHTLEAHWGHSIFIYPDSMSQATGIGYIKIIKEYGESIVLKDLYSLVSKNGYIVSFEEDVPSVMPDYDLHLVCVYLPITYNYNRSKEYKIIGDGIFLPNNMFNNMLNNSMDTIVFSSMSGIDRYLEEGYSKIKVNIFINIKEEDAGYQHIALLADELTIRSDGVGCLNTCSILLKNVNGDSCYWMLEHGGDGKACTIYSEHNLSATISLADFSTGNLYIVYGASGNNSNDWYNKDVKVTITFIK